MIHGALVGLARHTIIAATKQIHVLPEERLRRMHDIRLLAICYGGRMRTTQLTEKQQSGSLALVYLNGINVGCDP